MVVAVPREPRVLSGRSLQCLARRISASGIKLAAQLEVSDSTITGMAFDTMANGQRAADVTYRMLLLWKRKVAYWHRSELSGYDWTAAGDAQVDVLVQGIVAATGDSQVANAVLQCHRSNRELTPDCFLADQ